MKTWMVGALGALVVGMAIPALAQQGGAYVSNEILVRFAPGRSEVGSSNIRRLGGEFIADIEPYGHPDFQPKLVGRSITLMISPLPRNKRAKNPRLNDDGTERQPAADPAAQLKAPKLPKLNHPAPPPSVDGNETNLSAGAP